MMNEEAGGSDIPILNPEYALLHMRSRLGVAL